MDLPYCKPNFRSFGVLVRKLNLLKEKSRDINTDAKEKDEIKQVTSYHECSLPVDVKLNDEVRLEKINFSNQHELPELSIEDQCLVFAFYILVKKSKPKDDLAHEQLLPYLQAILSGNASNEIWALRFSSLLVGHFPGVWANCRASYLGLYRSIFALGEHRTVRMPVRVIYAV